MIAIEGVHVTYIGVDNSCTESVHIADLGVDNSCKTDKVVVLQQTAEQMGRFTHNFASFLRSCRQKESSLCGTLCSFSFWF